MHLFEEKYPYKTCNIFSLYFTALLFACLGLKDLEVLGHHWCGYSLEGSLYGFPENFLFENLIVFRELPVILTPRACHW